MKSRLAGKAGIGLVMIAMLFPLVACSRGVVVRTAAVDCTALAGAPDAPLLLFGEMHGSQESPALIHGLVCDVSARQEVAVGLEIPSGNQPLFDAYMASAGNADDARKLISSEFWQQSRDGRSSVAMLKLIEGLRALKQAGRPVSLFAFDEQTRTSEKRDVAVANGVRRFHDAHPDVRIIALMGNFHARQATIQVGENTMIPSGKLLADLHPMSVFVSYPAGTIWACMPDCGMQTLTTAPGEATPGFHDGAPMGGYSRTYRLATITASPPAAGH
jgi:hypothetical protein